MHAVMYYQNIKCSLIYFLVLIIVLSLNVCELQCSGISGNVLTNDNDTYNQRNILIDRFQNALMNDSEQLFTLQKALLLPRPIGGLCLTVKVTVKGKVADDTYVPVYSYYSCDYNNLCHYSTSKQFELLPAPVAPSIPRSLADFLRSNDIVQVLAALDPSFHVLINIISNEPILLGDLYYDDDLYSPLPPSKNYDIPVYVVIDKINITDVGGQIEDDITDALYVTLSWVSWLYTC